MKIDAQIICRRNEGYGLICDWKGPRNGVAKIYGEDIMSYEDHPAHVHKLAGKVFKVGRLKLRVVQFPVAGESGMYSDAAAVMLESPHAELYWLYRAGAERFVRLVLNFEARIRGFMLKPVYGAVMPVTKAIADRLL